MPPQECQPKPRASQLEERVAESLVEPVAMLLAMLVGPRPFVVVQALRLTQSVALPN